MNETQVAVTLTEYYDMEVASQPARYHCSFKGSQTIYTIHRFGNSKLRYVNAHAPTHARTHARTHAHSRTHTH